MMTYTFQRAAANFPNPVKFVLPEGTQQYMVGLTFFRLAFPPGHDNKILTMAINLNPQPSGNELIVTYRMQFNDGVGNSIDYGESALILGCVSTTNDTDGMVIARSVNNTLGAGRPVTFGTPAGAPMKVWGSGMSGFYCNNGFRDRNVLQFSVTGGYEPTNIRGGTVWSDMILRDSSNAQGRTLNQNMVAFVTAGETATTPASPLMTRLIANHQEGIARVDFGQSIEAQTVAFINEFNVEYPNGRDQQVERIAVGSKETPDVSGSTVTLPSVYAQMNDKAGHVQDNNVSHCSMTVFAVPS